jgi:hypothetical protein
MNKALNPSLFNIVLIHKLCCQHAGKNNALIGLQFEASYIFTNFLTGSGGFCYLSGTVLTSQPLAVIVTN